MSPESSSVKRTLHDLYASIGIVRACIIAAVVCSAALILPDQAKEIYRILADDYSIRPAGLLISFLSLCILCLGILYVAQSLIISAPAERFTQATKWRSLLLPFVALVVASPFLALCVGLWAANLSERCPDFDRTCKDLLPLSGKLNHGLLNLGYISAAAFVVISAAALFFLARLPLHVGGGSSRYFRRKSFLVMLTSALVLATTASLFPAVLGNMLGPISIFCLFCLILLLVVSAGTQIFDRTGIPLLSLLVLLAVIWSMFELNENHQIRVLPNAGAAKTSSAGGAFVEWLESRADLGRFRSSGKPYPVYIIAAEGGGLYAAYHAAATLAALQDSCSSFAQHVFAISGVSGGSLGAAVFAAAAKAHAKNAAEQNCARMVVHSGRFQDLTNKFFAHDFLSPLLIGTMLPDFLQRFLPFPIGPFDRARYLERSFERTWRTADPSGNTGFEQSLRTLWSPDGAAPALLLNVTEVRSGGVELIAPFRVELDALGSQTDLWLGTKIEVPLSTAVGLSARFPWITPAGVFTLRPARALPETYQRSHVRTWQFVDGGYYENSGTEVAGNLVALLQDVLGDNFSVGGLPATFRKNVAADLVVAFHIIAIGADLGLGSEMDAFGELSVPVRALLNSTQKRGMLSRVRVHTSVCPTCGLGKLSLSDTFRTKVLSLDGYPLPLGWMLSENARKYILGSLGDNRDCPFKDPEVRDVDASIHNVNNCLYHYIFSDLN